MTDKELIKQEIEKRIEQCYRCLAQDLLEIERKETNCCLQQYKELLQFIDSIEEEPASKDLGKIQLINKEIDRLIAIEEETSHLDKLSFNSGRWKALTQVKVFIDSITEPSSDDLEEELHSWMKENCDDSGFFNPLDLASHFAEWGKNHFEDKSKMVSEDLTEDGLTELDKIVQSLLNEPHYQDIHAVKEWSKILIELAKQELEKQQEQCKVSTEDVKIAKELIRYLPYCDDISKDTKERWISGLEKIIHHLNPEWSKEDDDMFEEICSSIKYAEKHRKTTSPELAAKQLAWINSIKDYFKQTNLNNEHQ